MFLHQNSHFNTSLLKRKFMVKQEIFHINKRLKSGSVRIYNFLIKTVMHKAYLDHVSNVYYMVNMWCKQTPTLVTFIIKLLYDINKILKNLNAVFLLRKTNILPYFCFQLPHRPIFLVTTLKIFWSPAQPKKKTILGLPMVKHSYSCYFW